MKKIVINGCFGGFGLSEEAMSFLQKNEEECLRICRWDPRLIDVVEHLGAKANGDYTQLKIVEVEAGRKFIIQEYDGNEGIVYLDDLSWIVL